VRHVYLDHNATTPVDPMVVEAMSAFYREKFGNPSSIHWAGRLVKGAVEKARDQVALLVGCDPSAVVFTSGGTEADNMALKGVAAARRDRGNHIITYRTEHPAVLSTCLYLEDQGYDITRLGVNRDGMPDLAELEASITGRTILVSAMYANHETGTLFPVNEIGEIAARRRVCFHSDAVQAVGRVPLDFRKSNIGLLALSGHKFHAPKGTGALIIRKGVKLAPLIHGGPQERNRRAGTENVAGIVALGKACELALDTMSADSRRISTLRERLEAGIMARVPDVRQNGHQEKRLPNTSSLSFRDVEADALLMNLDLQGIAASAGSACSSGVLKESPVLSAMGVAPPLARGAIRFSLGRETAVEDIDYLLSVLPGIVERLRTEQ
jgi:cysteine desulfurase